jgi:hypothetical protein
MSEQQERGGVVLVIRHRARAGQAMFAVHRIGCRDLVRESRDNGAVGYTLRRVEDALPKIMGFYGGDVTIRDGDIQYLPCTVR